jgi:2-keto-4-pentenoate hydratase
MPLVGCVVLALVGVSGQRSTERAGIPMTEPFPAGGGVDEIARYVVKAQRTQRLMPSLPSSLPSLTRQRAYEIQLATLKEREKNDRRAGWKLAWSRLSNPEAPLQPEFGYIMQSEVYEPGSAIPSGNFVGGSPAVEAEVAVWIAKDLPGPRVTRDDVVAAISHVAASIEFVGSRLTGEHTRQHAIVDDVYNAGVVLGTRRAKLTEVDFATETGWVEVNGERRGGEGGTRLIMGKDPVEAVVWLANELIKFGQHLRANDFVVTGTVVPPPPVKAGDRARVVFSTLGNVGFELKP